MLDEFHAPAWWPQPRRIELVAPEEPVSVYVGLALAETDEIAATRTIVCEHFDLLAKTEAHVTLAYLGKVDTTACAALAERLCGLVPDDLAVLPVVGVGAARELGATEVAIIADSDVEAAKVKPRVAWWSVQPTPSLERFRNDVLRAIAELGLTTPDQPYHPHVTLGSRAAPGGEDADFDIFSVVKAPSLTTSWYPPSVRAERLHVTGSALLPASIACIRAW